MMESKEVIKSDMEAALPAHKNGDEWCHISVLKPPRMPHRQSTLTFAKPGKSNSQEGSSNLVGLTVTSRMAATPKSSWSSFQNSSLDECSTTEESEEVEHDHLDSKVLVSGSPFNDRPRISSIAPPRFPERQSSLTLSMQTPNCGEEFSNNLNNNMTTSQLNGNTKAPFGSVRIPNPEQRDDKRRLQETQHRRFEIKVPPVSPNECRRIACIRPPLFPNRKSSLTLPTHSENCEEPPILTIQVPNPEIVDQTNAHRIEQPSHFHSSATSNFTTNSEVIYGTKRSKASLEDCSNSNHDESSTHRWHNFNQRDFFDDDNIDSCPKWSSLSTSMQRYNSEELWERAKVMHREAAAMEQELLKSSPCSPVQRLTHEMMEGLFVTMEDEKWTGSSCEQAGKDIDEGSQDGSSGKFSSKLYTSIL